MGYTPIKFAAGPEQGLFRLAEDSGKGWTELDWENKDNKFRKALRDYYDEQEEDDAATPGQAAATPKKKTRAPNAWIIYKTHNLERTKEELKRDNAELQGNLKELHSAAMKKLGEQWKALPAGVYRGWLAHPDSVFLSTLLTIPPKFVTDSDEKKKYEDLHFEAKAKFEADAKAEAVAAAAAAAPGDPPAAAPATAPAAAVALAAVPTIDSPGIINNGGLNAAAGAQNAIATASNAAPTAAASGLNSAAANAGGTGGEKRPLDAPTSAGDNKKAKTPAPKNAQAYADAYFAH